MVAVDRHRVGAMTARSALDESRYIRTGSNGFSGLSQPHDIFAFASIAVAYNRRW
jgi:hypothetical protein